MWYEKQISRAAFGAFTGMSTVALVPSAVSFVAGISSTGPVAGGLFAAAQSAGYTVPVLQSLAMAGVTFGTKVMGGIIGTYLFSRS